MTLQTRLSEIEEAHVDAAFLALSKLGDIAIRTDRDVSPITAAINALEIYCRGSLKDPDHLISTGTPKAEPFGGWNHPGEIA